MVHSASFLRSSLGFRATNARAVSEDLTAYASLNASEWKKGGRKGHQPVHLIPRPSCPPAFSKFLFCYSAGSAPYAGSQEHRPAGYSPNRKWDEL